MARGTLQPWENEHQNKFQPLAAAGLRAATDASLYRCYSCESYDKNAINAMVPNINPTSNPILVLLKNSPEQVEGFQIQQVVSICADGRLTDSSECSRQLREFLKIAPSRKLIEYVDQCLEGFDNSGFVLQDIVNELGRRLDYRVVDGFYKGKANVSGHDGIWYAQDGHSLIVEVKTSDAYRINLDRIAGYREQLIAAGTVTENSSILLVVGRDDTGDLEAQVRGSRHAWQLRIISIDALARLVSIKERTDERTTARIRELFVPFEYTRLDRIIDIAFAVAEDTTNLLEDEDPQHLTDSEDTGESPKQIHTPREKLVALRERIAAKLGTREGVPLVNKGSVLYWNPDANLRAVISVSKHYPRGGYWYAYHPKWRAYLKDGSKGFYVLGCLDRTEAYAIPVARMESLLPDLYKTEKDSRMYWHVILDELPSGKLGLKTMKQNQREEISQFCILL